MGIVEFNQSQIFSLDRDTLLSLEEKVREDTSHKARLCLHSSPSSILHESVIVTSQEDKSQFIHRHQDTSETNIILKGKLLVVLFSDEGDVIKKFVLDKNSNILTRIERMQYHIALPLSKTAIFLEIKKGPFSPASNIEPEWVPDRFVDQDLYWTFINQIIRKDVN